MKLYIPKHHFMLYKVKIDALISKKNGHTRINKTLESRILDYILAAKEEKFDETNMQ